MSWNFTIESIQSGFFGFLQNYFPKNVADFHIYLLDENVKKIQTKIMSGFSYQKNVLQVSRLESDTYSCKLFTSENIFENRAYELDVASRAKVSLLQESFPLSSDEDLIVDSKSVVEFECEASHGFPPPTVAAFIGMLDSNSGEVISPSKNSTVKNQDGTFGIKVAYSFVAKPEHCGLYLKCVSMQPG